jgi:hypothetical protein
MPQVDGWSTDRNGNEYTIVMCPRLDCGILALSQDEYSGPYKIHEDFAYVIDEAHE